MPVSHAPLPFSQIISPATIACSGTDLGVNFNKSELIGLLSLGRLTASSSPVHAYYADFCRGLLEFVEFDALALGVLDPSGDRYTIRFFFGETVEGRVPGDSHPVGGHLFEAVFTSRSTVGIVIDDRNQSAVLERYPGLGPPLAGGYRSFAAAPLVIADRVIGGLVAARRTTVEFADSEYKFLSAAAEALATAVARLDATENLAKSNQRLECLAKVGSLLGSANEPREILDELLHELDKVLPVSRLVIALLDLSNRTESIDRWVVGIPIPYWDEVVAPELPARVLKNELDAHGTDVIVTSSDIAKAGEASNPGYHYGHRAGLKSFMRSAMKWRGEPIGTLSVRSTLSDAYGPDDLRFLEEIGSLLAGFISASEERRRASDEASRSAMLAERSRLAMDIHDSLAQDFASLVWRLSAFQLTLRDRGVDPETSDQVGVVANDARLLLEKTRMTAWDMKSDKFDETPLTAHIRDSLIRRSSEHGVRSDFSVSGTVRRLNRFQKVHVLRIAEEAIGNAVTHSGCRSIAIEMYYGNNELRMSVKDDGTGFDQSKIESGRSPTGGMGLHNLRDRARAMNADLVIDSSAGRGTVVRLTVPIAPLRDTALANEPAIRFETG